jgi:hypothetical protein
MARAGRKKVLGSPNRSHLILTPVYTYHARFTADDILSDPILNDGAPEGANRPACLL